MDKGKVAGSRHAREPDGQARGHLPAPGRDADRDQQAARVLTTEFRPPSLRGKGEQVTMTNNFATSEAVLREAVPQTGGAAGSADARFDLILLDPGPRCGCSAPGSVVPWSFPTPRWARPGRTCARRRRPRLPAFRPGPLHRPAGRERPGHRHAPVPRRAWTPIRALWWRRSLTRRYFLPKVLRVRDVQESSASPRGTWRDRQGAADVHGPPHARRDPEPSPTRVLVTDSEGNRWEFPDVREPRRQELRRDAARAVAGYRLAGEAAKNDDGVVAAEAGVVGHGHLDAGGRARFGT